MTIIYGLKNCDTCRNATKWLKENNIDHKFHDVRKDGLDKNTVKTWEKALGWENLLNKRGTTWRGLPDAVKNNVTPETAIDLMVEHPALIKRPVFEVGGGYVLGFKEEEKERVRALAS